MSNVIVVATHPDDETLGCGGTLLRHIANGDKVHWLLVTKVSDADPAVVTSQENVVKKVVDLYEFHSMEWFDFKPTTLECNNDLIGRISDSFRAFKPNIVYLPFSWDAHTDHRAVFDATWSSTKVFRYPFVKKILCMETISETDFSPVGACNQFAPTVFHDISCTFEKKVEILSLYEGQLGIHPFPRSILAVEALARLRGVAAGVSYAEAFMLMKEIV